MICIDIEPPKVDPFIVIAWYGPPSVSIFYFVNLEENLHFHDVENKEIIIFDTNCDLNL